MSFKVIEELCIGCGACDFSCPTGALTKEDTFLGLFTIDPYTCDDCEICVSKCPLAAIVPDPEWPVCKGRGCPLTSRRLAGFECAIWQERCPECGSTLWRDDGNNWACSRCGLGMKVSCPRTRRLEASGQLDAPLCAQCSPTP
ncbi:MAG: indolepyruvate ferredoxin oxidoreductase subunit alpha [Acidimicrobiales bacterium]|jgi:Pyruvate/2-oxoacid:ferredoxin oxidoreductase delta subunit/ribosomal protein S27AE